jgi:hypothetical protein
MTRYKIVTVATTNIVFLNEAELKDLLSSKGFVKVAVVYELQQQTSFKYIQVSHIVEIIDLDNQVTIPKSGRGERVARS